MMRTLFAILCAAFLLCVSTGSARADRQVYDTPGDQRPVVGDDDEPFVTAVPHRVQMPETTLPRYERTDSLSIVLAWIRGTTRHAAAFARARAAGIWPARPEHGSDA